MHITFITVGDTRRCVGGHIFNVRVCNELRALGDIVTEIVASGASVEEQEAAAAGLGARVVAAPTDVIMVDALARIVCAPWLDRWRAERPLVAMVHELASVAALDDASAARDRAVEAALLRADRLIAVSRNGRAILESHGVPPERIRIVQPGSDRPHPPTSDAPPDPNGSHPAPIPQGIGDVQPADRGTERILRALCVAQWIPRKGIDTLIAAWARLRPSQAVLHLIGETDADPAYTAAVRAAIAAAEPAVFAEGAHWDRQGVCNTPLRPASTTRPAGSRRSRWVRGVQPSLVNHPDGRASIVVSGAVDAATLEAAYAASDLFVLPSRYEGYGSVYAEALLRGLPIIAGDAGAIPELVGPDAGILVPPGDPAALAGALALLLDDAALRARLAAGSRRRGALIPEWDETVRGVRAVLAEAIAARS